MKLKSAALCLISFFVTGCASAQYRAHETALRRDPAFLTTYDACVGDTALLGLIPDLGITRDRHHFKCMRQAGWVQVPPWNPLAIGCYNRIEVAETLQRPRWGCAVAERAALATVPPTGSPAAPPQEAAPTPPPAQSAQLSTVVVPPAQSEPPSSVAPPPPQSAQLSSVAPPTSSSDSVSRFEAQLDTLVDLKTRGRITEEEYQVMRRRLVEGAKPESPGPAGANLSAPPPRLQPAPLQWLLGSWQGRQWREGTGEVQATLLDLRQVGHELRWEMFTTRGQLLATGTATLIADRLELRGWYTGGKTSTRSLNLTLTKLGEMLEGTGLSMENVRFFASYRKRTE